MFELHTTPEYRAWIDRLRDFVAKAHIASRLDRLQELEHWVDAKLVGDGIIELRIDSGPGYRLYCKKVGREIVLFLSGGEKRTQKRDVKKAKKIAERWRA